MAREMKNSGFEWIGEMPAEWSTNTAFQLFTQVKNKNTDLQEQNLLSLSYGKIKRKDIDTTEGLLPESFDGYNIIEANDIVLRLTDLQNDHKSLRVGISNERGIVTSAYLTIRNRSKSLPKYLYYYLHSFDIAKGFYGMGAGVRQGLNWDGIKWLKILTPPVPEQARIADFLDAECARIDEVIEKTRSSIEEYKKLKQSVITEAVTKGIRKYRPMKDSGIKWIGEIPAEWEIKKAKYISTSISKGNGITKEDVSEDGDIQCVRYGEIYSKYDGAFDRTVSSTRLDTISAPKHIYAGDILFAGTGELIEEIGKNIVYTGTEPCLAGGDIIVMSHSQNPVFLNYALNSQYSQMQKSRNKTKLKVVHISSGDIGNILLAVPPLDEQAIIGEYLDAKCSDINKIIGSKEALIKEMETYKKSLIFEYVTGKKEVAE